MESKEEKVGRVIGNVATLDLRNATEASISDIKEVRNAATVLYSRETADIARRINFLNVASMIDVPEDAIVRTGQETITADTLNNLTDPVHIVCIGQLNIHSNIPVQNIEQNLGGLYVVGQLCYPENLGPIVQPKIKQLIGQSFVIDSDAEWYKGKLVLDEIFLNSLPENSILAVFGSIKAPQILSDDEINKKIKKLQIFGPVLCREENAAALLSKVDKSIGKETHKTIIPTGFRLVEQELVLDEGTVQNLPRRKLFCLSDVRFTSSVTPETVDEHLDELIVKKRLISPKTLQAVVSKKTDVLATQCIFYRGHLMIVDDETTLSSPQLVFLPDELSLIVNGALNLDSDLDPYVIKDRVVEVYNTGFIHGTPEQIAALQTHIRINKGEMTSKREEEQIEEGIVNAAYYKL